MSKKNNLKNTYKEIKEIEKRNDFVNRHSNAEIYLDDKYNHTDSLKVKIKKGTLHIFGECFYHLHKLSYIKKDNFSKYVIRNRNIIGTMFIIGTLALGGKISNIIDNTNKNETTIVSELPDSNYITLNKLYVVQPKDTLSELSEKTGISQNDIKQANQFETSLLFEGNTIKLPYRINYNELENYTEIIDNGNMTAKSLAKSYETDFRTILLLNENTIKYDNDKQDYLFTTDTVIIPSFDKIEKKYK